MVLFIIIKTNSILEKNYVINTICFTRLKLKFIRTVGKFNARFFKK